MPTERILFKYVPVYDSNFSLAAGVSLSDAEISEGYEFCEQLGVAWKEATSVLNYYASLGFELPKQTTAYLVHPRGSFTPFSDPLTIHIIPDMDEAIATLTHEYCHVLSMAQENEIFATPIWEAAQKALETESFVTQDHVIINKLTEAGLYHIWGKERTDRVLSKERMLLGLDRAWAILDRAAINAENPIEGLRTFFSSK